MNDKAGMFDKFRMILYRLRMSDKAGMFDKLRMILRQAQDE